MTFTTRNEETLLNAAMSAIGIPTKDVISHLRLEDPTSIGKAYEVVSPLIAAFNIGWYHIKEGDIVLFAARVEYTPEAHEDNFHPGSLHNVFLLSPAQKEKCDREKTVNVKYSFFCPKQSRFMWIYRNNGSSMHDLGNSLAIID